MKKVLINIILIFVFLFIYFLQAYFFTWFKIAVVMTNMFVILFLFIGLYAHKYMGVTYGIIFGFLIDLFISKKVGITAIMLGAIGIMGTILDKNFSKENRITIILITTIATVLFEVGSQILSIFVYKNNIQVGIFIQVLLIECLYNALITIILYPIIQILGNKIEEEFKGNKILTRYF